MTSGGQLKLLKHPAGTGTDCVLDAPALFGSRARVHKSMGAIKWLGNDRFFDCTGFPVQYDATVTSLLPRRACAVSNTCYHCQLVYLTAVKHDLQRLKDSIGSLDGLDILLDWSITTIRCEWTFEEKEVGTEESLARAFSVAPHVYVNK